MKRTIKKVGVLGSGVMGSRIACHFAGVGIQVLLLDIVAKEFTESTKRRYRGGLKKCVPQKCFLKSSLRPSVIR